jgi:hypothetical protein
MRTSGLCLTIFVLLTSVCFSNASRAQGLIEVLFGGVQHRIESQSHYGRDVQHRPYYSVHARRLDSRHRRWKHLASQSRSNRHALLSMRRGNPVPAGAAQLSYAETQTSSVKALTGARGCSTAQEAIAKVIRDDPTLRSGDAYMTSDGLRIFDGDRQDEPKFVPVDQAQKLGRDLKARLAELQKTRPPEPAPAAARKSRIESASGPDETRGNSEQAPIKSAKERLIKTSTGQTIRLVGGFVN